MYELTGGLADGTIMIFSNKSKCIQNLRQISMSEFNLHIGYEHEFSSTPRQTGTSLLYIPKPILHIDSVDIIHKYTAEGGEGGPPPTFDDCFCIIVNVALKCTINADLISTLKVIFQCTLNNGNGNGLQRYNSNILN